MKSHARLIKLGLHTDAVIATRLLKAYVSYSPKSLANAHQLFDEIPFKDTVVWTSLISAYAQAGHPTQALHLFSQMHIQTQTKPNHFVFATAARACGSVPDLRLGKTVHACVIKHGFSPNVVVDTSILNMYAKCCAIEFSVRVFDEMPERNVISWNTMIAGYANNGMGICALELFHRMKCVECEAPDEFSVVTALSACAGTNDLALGKQIYAYAMCSGFLSDPATANAAANLYFRCGIVECAESALKGREESAMLKLIKIKGYVFNGRYQNAIKSIGYDFVEIILMDCSIVIPVLTACANLSLLRIGRQIHGLIVTSTNYYNCHWDDEAAVAIRTALIDMYAKCCSIEEAQRVFDYLPIQHVTHWNAMIAGYIHNGLIENAVRCFDAMPERNVISWTSMISGYVRYRLPNESIRLLAKMYHEDGSTRGNCFTFSAALNACSLLTALDLGKQIHAQSVRTVITSDTNSVELETALIDMYSKSGNLNYARRVFDRMGERNVVSWTSMIMGHAIHGRGSQALEVFQQMLNSGLEPNEVTFVVVLSACSHCGLVEEGMRYFKLMREKYGIIQRSEHYACMVDLLGRAGKLTEAWSLIEGIMCVDNDGSGDDGNDGAVLGALLGGCQLHGDVKMGSQVAKKMLERKQQVSETYIALSNVYASSGMWDEVHRLREEQKSQGIDKEPGRSQIETVVSVEASELNHR
ncbi:pentatricopeptide repeat-containing protein At5g16860-like [Magnolia sinica]|uniref:pentatricopeptide repeat-containing protein At5g16860-like n=1 Tax=Magnolia sinica TaxID=86752 RepID=UPI002658FA11|nr:pentatricopeptide repeat-containing protein At5g16860-like [Magnolia sinica]